MNLQKQLYSIEIETVFMPLRGAIHRPKTLRLLLFIFLPATLFAEPSRSDSTRSPEVKSLFWNLPNNLAGSYLGSSSLVHLGAVGATWVLIDTGVDAEVQLWSARRDKAWSLGLSVPGLVIGFVAPAAVPLSLYYLSDSPRTRNAGLATGQAVGIALVANNLLKAITGRLEPDKDILTGVEARARDFQFGFGRRGIYNGWPSGHAMTNTALAAALANYYSDSPKIRILSYSWAACVMASATFGNRGDVHWASDVVAGGLMGWIIGRTVGKAFAQPETAAQNSSLRLRPAILAENQNARIILQLTF